MNVGGTPPGQSTRHEGNTGETRCGEHKGIVLRQRLEVLPEACGFHTQIQMTLARTTLRITDQVQQDDSNDAQYGCNPQGPAPVAGQGGGL